MVPGSIRGYFAGRGREGKADGKSNGVCEKEVPKEQVRICELILQLLWLFSLIQQECKSVTEAIHLDRHRWGKQGVPAC